MKNSRHRVIALVRTLDGDYVPYDECTAEDLVLLAHLFVTHAKAEFRVRRPDLY